MIVWLWCLRERYGQEWFPGFWLEQLGRQKCHLLWRRKLEWNRYCSVRGGNVHIHSCDLFFLHLISLFYLYISLSIIYLPIIYHILKFGLKCTYCAIISFSYCLLLFYRYSFVFCIDSIFCALPISWVRFCRVFWCVVDSLRFLHTQ